MKKVMLIDATQAEETRVAVMNGTRLEEFDYESAIRKPIKGNFYLAKVTRVEPSLQAAFVNYGGNRHGFLPFSEIHPDYFRIPVADREALMEEREEMIRAFEEEHGTDDDIVEVEADGDLDAEADTEQQDDDDSEDSKNQSESDDNDDTENAEDSNENDNNEKGGNNNKRRRRSNHRSRKTQRKSREPWDPEDKFRYALRKRYKIQEVVKRGQIVLVQATKEERGNKGAAFTSYLSMPGRYCVLMPNSPRGGGVSRKIANYKDRDMMRDRLKKMDIPKGMSVILRTAGVERTQTEINRDLEYLLKLWSTIREDTLKSSAPALIYEEANLIKRIFRDVYTKDIDQIIVSGVDGYKSARNVMKMMIPSHVKKIKEHKNIDVPLFVEHKAERQIADIGEVQVTLPSGGYLVINPTEALVSIDVNSGRATKERHIEETALKTNLEAADEVARQLRLRDLGGLVVIDFIDMDNRRNNGKVERRMRDALSTDRARVQNSRISSFGLMELSRQRLSPSLTESQYETCDHCAGLGRVRSADATSIMALRAVEDMGIKHKTASVLTLKVRNAVAIYILNHKRAQLARLEERYNLTVAIDVDNSMTPSTFHVDITEKAAKPDSDNDNDNQADKDDSDTQSQSSNNQQPSEKKPRQKAKSSRSRSPRNDQSPEDNDEQQDTEKNGNKKSPSKPTHASQNKDDETSEDKKPKRRGRPKKSPSTNSDSAPTPKETKTEDVKEASKPKPKSPPKKVAADNKPDVKKDNAKKEDTVKETKEQNNNAAEYETVNEEPKKKKKGWWSI